MDMEWGVFGNARRKLHTESYRDFTITTAEYGGYIRRQIRAVAWTGSDPNYGFRVQSSEYSAIPFHPDRSVSAATDSAREDIKSTLDRLYSYMEHSATPLLDAAQEDEDQ